jgi:hypothetical protein
MEKTSLSALILGLILLSSAYSASQTAQGASQYINNMSCTILFLVEIVAITVSALVLLFMGIKYKASSSDTASRHAAREGMVGAVTGLIILALALLIVNMEIKNVTGAVSCKMIPSPGELIDAFSSQYLSAGNANIDQPKNESIESLPDLVLEKAAISDQSKSPGEGYSITITVGYKGNGNPLCNFEIVSYLETGRELDTIPVCKVSRDSEKKDYCVSEGKPSIELECGIGDSSGLKEQMVSFLSDGREHYLVVSADPSGTIKESDKKDNTLRIPLAELLKNPQNRRLT